MKTSTNNNSAHDKKFNQKLNHLQGFMGMPNWNFGSPTFDEIQEYDKQGRKLQAQAMSSMTNKLKQYFERAFVKILRKVGGGS